MKQLAAFATSDAGKAYARIEERFGRDPARALEDVDDVLAHNLRAAFVVALAEDIEDDPHRAAVEKTRKAGEGPRG